MAGQYANEAEEIMSRMISLDYSGPKPALDRNQALGYLNVLKQGGLFLVDIGNGSFDTYLSLADVEALTTGRRGASLDRLVKLHSAHIGTMQLRGAGNEISLRDLKKHYKAVNASDSEGNELPMSSARRMSRLGPILSKAPIWTAPKMGDDVRHGGPVAEAVPQEKKADYLKDEKERIIDIINEEERTGKITSAQAEHLRNEAMVGNLILVDMVGDGNFDDYLSLDKAHELMANPSNKDLRIRLFDANLAGDLSGEVGVGDLEDVFARKQALGASLGSGQEDKPEELPKKEEKLKSDIPTTAPLAVGGTVPGSGVGSESGKTQSDVPRPGLPIQFQGREPKRREAAVGQRSEIPTTGHKPLAVQTRAAAGKKEENEGVGAGQSTGNEAEAETTQQQQAAQVDQKRQQEERKRAEQNRKGPNRYEPAQPVNPRQKKRKRGAIAAIAGTGGAAVGGPVGFVIFRNLGDSPDLTGWIPEIIQHVSNLSQFFV